MSVASLSDGNAFGNEQPVQHAQAVTEDDQAKENSLVSVPTAGTAPPPPPPLSGDGSSASKVAQSRTQSRTSIRRRSDAPLLYTSAGLSAAEPEQPLQLSMLPSGLVELLAEIDVDNSGTVEWEEFLAFALPSGSEYGHIKRVWRQLLSGEYLSVGEELHKMKGSQQVSTQLVAPLPASTAINTCRALRAGFVFGEGCGASSFCRRKSAGA